MKIKGNVYRTLVRPTLMYGAETWVLKKALEKNWRLQKGECYDGCAELRSWAR